MHGAQIRATGFSCSFNSDYFSVFGSFQLLPFSLYKIHNKFLSTIVTLLFHMWLQTFDHNLSQDTAAQPQTL